MHTPRRTPPFQFSLRSILVVMTMTAAFLIPAKLLLSDPKFRIVAWWCGIVAVGYVLFGLSGSRLLRREQLQIDEARRKILADQIEKRDAEKDSEPPMH